MRLRHIIIFIFTILFLSVLASSCNDSNNNSYTSEGGSNDAQIQSFTLSKGYVMNKTDSVNFIALPKTVFAIDQINNVIYNPDSLPYLTRLTKFLPTISFGNNTGLTMEAVYPDSTVTWKITDSINFADRPIELRVTPASKENQRYYRVKLNVHQIDPDTIDWKQLASIPKVAGSQQKALILGNNIYVYVLQGSSIKLYMSDVNNPNWSPATIVSGLDNTVKLESITTFKNKFYAIDNVGNAYKSDDAISWTKQMNTDNIHSILGVLPENVETKDSLLVVTKVADKYYFGKTIDMKAVNTVKIVKGYVPNTVTPGFPSNGFSSVTNYNRSISAQNTLMVSGGKTFEGKQTADTWLINSGYNNELELSPSYYISTSGALFDVKDDFKTFMYDNLLYAATNDSLYTSKWGDSWAKSPAKQRFKPKMKTAKDMSIIVDDHNYIWIVGNMDGSAAVYNVWRGRLNRLIK